ncbi:BMC domain-containing protein [Paenibacillus sp. DMB20]|uniref:BMC domain-containing protein n=1 Tax=Paenibacillus sp. DMB20 TaxID=1642570 RepID=UPI00069A2715
MRHSALGLVEVRGYLGAVAAADAALKAASVSCIGVEVIKGGLTTVKLDGDVGAVQAAVEAGAAMAAQLNVLVTSHVIARLHEETKALVANQVEVSQTEMNVSIVEPQRTAVKEETAVMTDTAAAGTETELTEGEAAASGTSPEAEAVKAAEPAKAKETNAAESKKPVVQAASQADKADFPATPASKAAEEVKPASKEAGAEPQAHTAQAAGKPNSAHEKQSNANNLRVKPSASASKPTAKQNKNTKKASS